MAERWLADSIRSRSRSDRIGIVKNLRLQSFNFYVEKRVLLCIALSLNISILQLKLKKRFGETNIKKICDCNKIEKKQAV